MNAAQIQRLYYGRAASAEDDSPFLSMADFFSLISLTLIYLSLSFAPQSAVPEDAITVLLGRLADSGQTRAADSKFAYVMVNPDGDGLRVSVLTPQSDEWKDRLVSLQTPDLAILAAWVERELGQGFPIERVVFHISDRENRPETHLIFNGLVRAIRQRYAASIVFL